MMTQLVQILNERDALADSELLTRYQRQDYRKVGGWLTKGALELIRRIDHIQKESDIGGHAVEIGVHHGRLFILLHLMLLPEEHSVAVDVFETHGDLNVDDSGRGNLSVFRRNLSRYAEGVDRVKILCTDSLEIGGKEIVAAAGGKARLFSIDGGHTAETTRHDLETASEAVTDGGVIILDDYFNPVWPDVSIGANRYMVDATVRKIHPFLIGGNKLFFTTGEGFARRYRKAVVETPVGTKRKTSFMNGHEVLCVDFDPLTLKEKVVETSLWKHYRNTSLGHSIRKMFNRE